MHYLVKLQFHRPWIIIVLNNITSTNVLDAQHITYLAHYKRIDKNKDDHIQTAGVLPRGLNVIIFVFVFIRFVEFTMIVIVVDFHNS